MTDKEKGGCGCAVFFALAIIAAQLQSCEEARQKEAYVKAWESGWRPPVKELEWFEPSGNLCEATVLKWKAASERDRLATCGEWLRRWWKAGYTIKKYKSTDDLRMDAQRMLTELDVAVSGSGNDRANINQVATLVAMLMNLLTK